MSYAENFRYFVIAGIVFLVLYVFLAIKPLSTELQITTDLSINIEQATDVNTEIAVSDGEKPLPFRLSYKAGYFTQEGKLLFSRNIPYKATLSDNVWAQYDSNASSIQVMTPQNTILTTINESGFPFFQGDRLYLLPPGGNTVAEYTLEGNKKWFYEGFTPITAFNSSTQGSVIGFANGNLVCLSPEGNEQFSFYPGGSKYQVILGAAIAPNANLTACISGIDKQRFILSSHDNKLHKIIYHEYLSTDQKEQMFVGFSKDSKAVYFQYQNGLGVVDCEKLSCTHIPLSGSVRQIEEMPSLKLSIVLTQFNGLFYVYFLEDTNRIAGSFSFKASSACIIASGSSLFLGTDSTISKLTITRK